MNCMNTFHRGSMRMQIPDDVEIRERWILAREVEWQLNQYPLKNYISAHDML